MYVAATAPEIGVPLGMLIGLVTGCVAILLLRTGWNSVDTKGAIQVVGELLALPAFWFGGPWLTTTLLATVEPEEIRSSYLITLTVVFVALAIWPLARLVWATGLAIGGPARTPPAAPSGGADA